jgi:hypothetical protein
MNTNITMKTYPHYSHLPQPLSHNLNILRTNVYDGNIGHCDLDVNDIEFLNLDLLVEWLKITLPEYDRDFLEAAARIHHECYTLELFDYFGVDEGDLFQELLCVKDEYELKIALETKGE